MAASKKTLSYKINHLLQMKFNNIEMVKYNTLYKVVPSAQSFHFWKLWKKLIVGNFNPTYFGEANSRIQTCNMLLWVEGTCHLTRPNL